jgi:nucleotide-binding universal stress UspA family protein
VTLVVGYAPDGHGRAVLHLAAMLARSGDEDLLVGAIVPASWPPSPAKVDAEYRAYLGRLANEALEHARARLPGDVRAEFTVHHSRSAAAGLVELAEQHKARMIVLGSSAGGYAGYVSIGSTTSRLMHSSPVSLALAPRGFRAGPDARVTRATAAFGASDSEELVVAAATVAAQVGASLRLASFAVRPRAPYTSGVGTVADEAMVADWIREMRAAGRAALESVETLPEVPHELDAVVGAGDNWEDALEEVEWHDGDVLLVGSSSIGTVARVFLGSRATKIVRNSPVPVIVVPRGRAAELAEDARAGSSGA